MSARLLFRWDIFCKVVDNYGDIGVCWRLARQMAHQHGCAVRLWIDDLNSFQRLVPEIESGQSIQHCRQIEIRHWQGDIPSIGPEHVADVVIEAFGCAIPESYIVPMARWVEAGRSPPVWINLEYLSAEPWVASHHGLPSPHPRLPLTKYFFFPGFQPETGGLLCEAGLQQRRIAFQSDIAAQETFWETLGLASPADNELRISMFAYTRPETERLFLQLLRGWSEDSRRYTVLIPEGVLTAALADFFGQPVPVGRPVQRGALTVQTFTFLDQDDYDRLLWACDVNFVRGEDSFVRAQWAGRPLVWQIYPQKEGVHLGKLDAFLNRYTQDLPPDLAAPMQNFCKLWNQADSVADKDLRNLWQAFEQNFPALNPHANAWINQISEGGDLASRLWTFVEAV